MLTLKSLCESKVLRDRLYEGCHVVPLQIAKLLKFDDDSLDKLTAAVLTKSTLLTVGQLYDLDSYRCRVEEANRYIAYFAENVPLSVVIAQYPDVRSFMSDVKMKYCFASLDEWQLLSESMRLYNSKLRKGAFSKIATSSRSTDTIRVWFNGWGVVWTKI